MTARLRWEFIAIRANVFLIPAIAPIGAVVVSQALGNWIADTIGLAATAAWLNLGCLLVFLAILPWIFASSWRARLPDGPLRDALAATIQSRRVRFFDIRVWPTGNQLTNAMVVGIFPKLRMLILTDRLVRLLNPEELCVVVAHEAGHVRLGHLLTRIWFVLLPLVAFSIVALAAGNLSPELYSPSLIAGLQIEPLIGIIAAAAYAAYALWIMAWISRKMEFQADLFACRATGTIGTSGFNVAATRNFCESLIKLAADSSEDVRRSGWLHPSVASRVQFLRRAAICPSLAGTFERAFRRQKLWITATICGAAVLFAWL